MIKFNLYPCTHFIKDLPDFDGTVSMTNLDTGEEVSGDMESLPDEPRFDPKPSVLTKNADGTLSAHKPGWIEAWMPSAPSKDAKPWHPRDLAKDGATGFYCDPEDPTTIDIDEQGRVSGMGKPF